MVSELLSLIGSASPLDSEATRRRRSNFFLAFLFLPREQRRALEVVYRFCRHVDDAVDDARTAEEATASLERWHRLLDLVYAPEPPPPRHFASREEISDEELQLVTSLWQVARTYSLARVDFESVMEGCAWDAVRTRYATWEELRAYCYRVASSVGLLSIAIFGARGPRARDYAIELGIALQLINILRDLDEDAARGRLYLPLEDLADFSVTEAELLAGRRTVAVRRLLAFEAERAALHHERARAAIGAEDRARLAGAELMGDLYHALLDELRTRGFPSGRLRLTQSRKAALAVRRYVLRAVARRQAR